MLSERVFAIAQIADQAILLLLVLLSIVSIGLILERFFSLRKVASDSRKVRERVKSALQSHNLDEVEDIAKDDSTIEGRAAKFALRHIKESGEKGLEEVFNTFSLSERPELERSLGFLATIGSNAPYIGLLGTVLGIMKAFQDLAQSSDAGQQTVMAGISLALVATAAGLFVAIPAVVAYNYFQRQVKGILQSLESVKELSLAYAKKKGA
ncbi:MAG: MotA/TolQ/ExbB proton channel family protein [Bdellovibrionaceae bacterium]|nr:MotA/TolQ/ExbB proton channel family protein [Pseudobdellovibrionaceae bacterium]